VRYFYYTLRLLACLALATLACCGKLAAPPSGAVPQRIVSLSPTVTEILYELGLGDKVIADTKYCTYPEDAKNKEKIGDFLTVNEEKIISLHPDLVIDTTSQAHEAMWERMERAGIRVEHFNIDTMDGVYEAYAGIGRTCGIEQKARALADSLRRDLADLRARCAAATTRPRVLFFVEYPNLTAVGKDTFIDSLINDIGCVNAVDKSGWLQGFPRELAVSMRPDVIIFAIDGNLLTGAYAKEIKDSFANATNVPAVANGRVLVVNGDMTTRPGPRLVKGWREIAKLVHPELFE
jgi:iron complex transport system substrate-binding protein